MDKCTKLVKLISVIVIFVSAFKAIKDVAKSYMVILGCTKLLKAVK